MTLGEKLDDPTSNDDYVAQLLASEAKDKSLKYSALGLQAYLPRRPTDRAPKPNTRFLKNILRDTDSHNAALKRKEEEEARERMRKLRGDRSPSGGRSERRDRRRDNERSHRNRSPHHREKERSSKRKQLDDSPDRDHRSRSKRHHRYHREDESESDRDRESSSRSHRRHRGEERRSVRRRDSSRSRTRRSRHHSDERSASPGRSRSRSRSPNVSRRHRNDDKEYERRKTTNGHSGVGGNGRLEARRDDYNSDSESDPLEDFVGPLPATSRRREQASAVPTRGRGSYRTNASTIDSHFAQDYDPKLDVDISENDDNSSLKRTARRPVAGLMTQDDDWDMALEALRDRANWKQKGEERLRAAGFDENTVKRWKQDPAFSAGSNNNDTEGRIEDVKWAKKGEGREWDRGKVMNDDGQYDVKAQW